ncbi:MAG: hypothetical protein FWG72_02015 [Oscillospiraceae bacterium]|nr:hypothetical protein [Oscillospiraceae bacterium]
MKKQHRKRPHAAVWLILAVILLELTLWNRPYYAHFFQGAEASAFETQFITDLGGVYIADDEMSGDAVESGLPITPAFVFRGLDRRVGSVYIRPYTERELGQMQFAILYGDEDGSQKQTAMTVIPGVEGSYHQEINPYGKVSYLMVALIGENCAVREVSVNRPIPFRFNLLRVLLFSALALGAFFFVKSDVTKTVFDPKSRKQGLILALVLVLFSALTLQISRSTQYYSRTGPYAHMVTSLLDGRLDLGIDAPPALSSMDNPYDYSARQQLGLPTYSDDPEGLIWDNAYYNGRFYMQHGIVPVVLLYLPYRLLTGGDLPNGAAVWVLVSLSGVFLALLWRKIIFRFIRQMPFVMLVCTTVAVLFTSMIVSAAWLPRKYEVSSAGAMMFAALGLWLLLPKAAPAGRGGGGRKNALSQHCYGDALSRAGGRLPPDVPARVGVCAVPAVAVSPEKESGGDGLAHRERGRPVHPRRHAAYVV